MHIHLLEEITPSEKVELLDYLDGVKFNNKPSKNKMLKIINIPKATYYCIKNHIPSDTECRRNEIKNNIHDTFFEFKEIYGSPKLYNELIKKFGANYVSERTVSVYMRQMGLKSITVPKFKTESKNEIQLPFNLPLVNYIKTDRPTSPHTHILTDMTYIYTIQNGWTYLLTYMDMYTRKILSWDLSDAMTAAWVTQIAKELIDTYPNIQYIHSDQGSQYTSKVYLKRLLTNGISPSFSSKGYPYHNAWIESFHAQLKKEYIYRRTLKDVQGAKDACFNYIEGFYNTIRSQKALGYISPNEFEMYSLNTKENKL